MLEDFFGVIFSSETKYTAIYSKGTQHFYVHSFMRVQSVDTIRPSIFFLQKLKQIIWYYWF